MLRINISERLNRLQAIEHWLNKLPKSVQPKAKADMKEIWQAESRADAEKASDRFLAKYRAKYDKAANCLARDRETLLAFYDFPAEHWTHIRTSNPIEKKIFNFNSLNRILGG
jgi:transposase-like protein